MRRYFTFYLPRFTFHVLSALFLCAVAAVCHAEERWALLVGIDQYSDDIITPLKGAVHDTMALRDALINYAAFPPDNIFCLTSSDQANLPDLGNIVVKLEYIVSKMNPGDVFIFFFAGHGVSIQYEGEPRSYLLTYETDIRSDLLLMKKGLWVEEELIGCLEKIDSGKIILILDACRNDPSSGRGDEDNVMTDQFERAFRVSRKQTHHDKQEYHGDIDLHATIYACKTGERAYEYPGKERGFFSIAFEEALSGKADRDRDRKVTLHEVESYLRGRVSDLIGQTLGGGRKQTPRVVIDGDTGAGDWVFSWASEGLPPMKTGKPDNQRIDLPASRLSGSPSRLAAVSWSLLPGGGQFYNSRPKKALILGGLEITGIGAAIVSHLAYSETQDKYMNATKITDIEKYNDDAGKFHKGRTIFSAVSAAVLLYNIYDAYSDARKY
jgi:hypothetical protein